MIIAETARQIALSMPGTEEYDHVGRPAFRANNRTFSTLWMQDQLMMVKLSPIDQSVFCAFDSSIFYPVPNKWGQQGFTLVDLKKVRLDMLTDAIKTAWQTVMDKKKISKRRA